MKNLFLTFLLALPLHAQLIQSFSGGNNLSVGPGTAAFEFTASVPEMIKFLGVYDSDPESPGLFSSHFVGIWDAATHALMSSVVVPDQGAVNIGGFYYSMIPPVSLAAGHTYVIGASYADSDFDLAVGNIDSVSMQSGNVMGDARLSSGSGFEFPDLSVPGANLGFVGANAIFAQVPEPMSAVAVGLMLVIAAATATVRKAAASDLSHAKRRQPLAEEAQPPATNRPPVTPGNEHGKRPIVPPGLQNYGTP